MKRILENPMDIIIGLIIIILLEIISFIAFKVAIKRLKNNYQRNAKIIYWCLNILSWILIFTFKVWQDPLIPSSISNVAVTLMQGVAFGKVLTVLLFVIGIVINLIIEKLIPKKKQTITSEQDEYTVNKYSRGEFIAQLSLLGGATLLGTFIHGISNRYNYQVKKVPLILPNLPDSFNGLKIVHISDIHSGSFDDPASVMKGVKKIMELQPDMILFTGDIVNSIATEILPYKHIFAKLSARFGVFAVLGNHDYGDYYSWNSNEEKVNNLNQLKQHIADMNWELLMNEHVVFDNRGGRLAIIGVENWSKSSAFPKYGRLDDAMSGISEKNPDVCILMSHDPSHWDAEVRKKYPNIDLTLSGHTHGMQFGVKLPWLKWSPSQYMYKQWDGLYQEGKQYLYVNPGFGYIGYRGRVGILPEITLIELSN